MRTSLIAFLALTLLVCTGCQQMCCARDNVVSGAESVACGAKSVASSVENTWNCAKRTVCTEVEERSKPSDCDAPCEVNEVYANYCGGDSGIGRTGTGAFAIPATP